MTHYMTRTIHPVGHGAFYTEIFDNGFTAVYDCGSHSSILSNSCRHIENTVKGIHHIDLMFLSHFHSDHVNRFLYILKANIPIERLLIPYYSWEEKLILIGGLSLHDRDSLEIAGLISSPRLFITRTFATTGIRVSAVVENGFEGPFSEEDYSDLIQSGQSIRVITNRSHLQNKEEAEWIYIPFNLKSNAFKVNAENFYRHLVGVYPKFASPIQITNAKDLEDIRREYLAFFKKGLNETSMQVLSTPKSPEGFLACDSNCHLSTCGPNCATQILRYASCLYTGDFQIKNYSNIELDGIYNALQQYNLGMIQVPHHCSKTSFVRDFWDKIRSINTNIISFISHGYKYSHPYQPLVSLLQSRGFKVVEVTDKSPGLKVDVIRI